MRRGGRAVEGGVLLRRRPCGVRGFESRPLREHVKMADMKGRGEVSMVPCPECGAYTSFRYRKSDGGPFLGCVRYPRCKGIASSRNPMVARVLAEHRKKRRFVGAR